MRNVRSKSNRVTISRARKGIVSCLFVSATILGLLAAYLQAGQTLGGTTSLKGSAVASLSLTPAHINEPGVIDESCSHTPCPGFSACADFQTDTCFDGTWPDGLIYYDFS
jgi:hypothetical protein